ncbi:hypothetical protein A3C23_05895 [Candidatus Roizmanbacteria bacterium RIFCSPHIGHO2_02_FULL_37_13b]|uniref:L-threonylcarbamoyladenylate synthase n=1 Tax=Candidatus Roizmanbacteria bacterium RIFCSPLOWO2_02_FULL_36_11 TaxID=1802071 RepID=A0A1F7JCQ9_9BACT|nr:MAG: hypothetical protein A3C23_05895 [Candidatus Roizmanbacteria bacterium RIFCSPHIGHO2_02_FULL_37_13b]OGK53400.1 MAG: hypothetical protein A3H78_02555 [Candidatus Roizmanbacteria bacterium RIFCSPLOWO2_02_FULL_36_11]
MEIIKLNKKKISEAVDQTINVLKKGGLVVVPTDTVYGLAVDAENEAAIAKLIQFKSRPAGKAISIFVASLHDAKRYVVIDSKNESILKEIFPGPFTAILNSKHKSSRQLESDFESLGIRIPDNLFINELLVKYGRPITATSANLSGGPIVYSVDNLFRQISRKKRDLIDLVVNYGKLPYHKPSTVIDLTGDKLTMLRLGDNQLLNKKSYISASEAETKKIASEFIKKYDKNNQRRALAIILQGELGSGKTQFVKGIGAHFGIKDIISPSFVVYYEYNIPRQSRRRLYHVDLYNISEKNEFAYLGFEEMLKPRNIICIEWGEKSAPIYNILKDKSIIVHVKIKYSNENRRQIEISINNL